MQGSSTEISQPTQPPLPEPLLRLTKSIVRPYHPSDAASISAAANTRDVSKWLTGVFPYPYEIPQAEFWLSIANSERDFAIVALDNATVMGSISLKPFTDIHYRTVELGFWLGEKYWGKGIMTEVTKAFCEKAFEREPKLLRIQAEVIDGNQGSGRVLEKSGFTFECRRRCAVEKKGVVYDCLCYVMLREEC